MGAAQTELGQETEDAAHISGLGGAAGQRHDGLRAAVAECRRS